MRQVRIAAVGPVVAEVITDAGLNVAVASEESFHFKPMIATMKGLFASL